MVLDTFDIPILLIMFNRPDNAKIVFDKIKEIKPQKLFIAIDGPRLGNISDQIGVEGCIRLIDSIDWPCELYTNIQEKNLGCGLGVSSAINWFFSKVEMGIILEDDCVPALSFFSYCREMLFKYKDNSSIMHIAGTRWNEEYITKTSYFFSSISHIWGWATWRRAWELYDFNMGKWPEMRDRNHLKNFFNQTGNIKYWVNTFDREYNKLNKSTWDYQWQYSLFLNHGLSINPSENLVINIGVSGSHSKPNPLQRRVHFRSANDLYKITKSPVGIKANREYDDYHTKLFFRWKPPILFRAYNRLQNILNKR